MIVRRGSPVVVLRRRAPVVMIRRRGVGVFNPGTFTPTSCDPHDVACVAGNVAESVAYQQSVINAHEQDNFDRCIQNANANSEPWRSQMISACSGQITAQPTPQQAANTYIQNFQDQAAEVRAELSRAGQSFIPDAVKIAPTLTAPVVAAKSSSAPASTTPAGSTVVSSSGAQSAPGASVSDMVSGGAGVPMWVWLVGGGAALLLLRRAA